MKTTLRALAASAALVTAAAAPLRQGADEALRVGTVRFFQAGSATTTIEGVCEVRLPALLRGVAQVSRYRVEIAVLDSAGLELQHSDWTREVPASLAHARGATVVESFGFSAAPGRYRIRVRVTPTSGDAVERTAEVMAYASAPALSDLLLASSVRQPASDSEPLAQGEVRVGGLAMRTAPAPRLTPAEAALSWYAEIYPRAGTGTGEIRAEVVGNGGRTIVATTPRSVTVPAGGGMTRGSLDLSGLPEGDYVLRLRVRLGDSVRTAEAPFSMGSIAAFVAAQPAAPAAGGISGADQFDEASEARLDSLAAPLVYLAENQRELSLYRTLTLEGKRRFLREFWQRRDPTPGTPDNPARDAFYRAVAYVNETFKESGAGDQPGWNSDRGRIYLMGGRPDETLQRPAASPKPFEVWKYTRDRPRWYVFQDATGFGHYTLLATNDRREVGRQNWESILGADGTRDAYQFLGLDLRDLNNNVIR
jgi:GWxTD domain-containing protein